MKGKTEPDNGVMVQMQGDEFGQALEGPGFYGRQVVEAQVQELKRTLLCTLTEGLREGLQGILSYLYFGGDRKLRELKNIINKTHYKVRLKGTELTHGEKKGSEYVTTEKPVPDPTLKFRIRNLSTS